MSRCLAPGQEACGRQKEACPNEALAIAHDLGVKWMATDEGVLCRSLGTIFQRDGSGKLEAGLRGAALPDFPLAAGRGRNEHGIP